jgi:hypothetical protein
MEGAVTPVRVRWVDQLGRQANSVRFLKSAIDRDLESIQKLAGGIEGVASLLIHGDNDVDVETVGTLMTTTSRVYINRDNQLVHRVQQFEIVRHPDGTERDRRPKERAPQNVSGEIPIRWSGVYLKRTDVVRRFVFSNKLQLTHINGLTYDFLFAMARELHHRDSMLLVGAGPKSNEPLILRRGSIPYRGFLEGRIRGESYLLLLHLSNLELKSPAEVPDTDQ